MDHRDRNRDWILLVDRHRRSSGSARGSCCGRSRRSSRSEHVLRTRPQHRLPAPAGGAGVLLILFATRRDLFTRPDGRAPLPLARRARHHRCPRRHRRVLRLGRRARAHTLRDRGCGDRRRLAAARLHHRLVRDPRGTAAGTVIPPQWPQTGVYTPPPTSPQPYYPPAPGTPARASALPPTAPSVPEIPRRACPCRPGRCIRRRRANLPPRPAAPAPPTAPTPDEPTTPPANG